MESVTPSSMIKVGCIYIIFESCFSSQNE
jgi:hypothetical protein